MFGIVLVLLSRNCTSVMVSVRGLVELCRIVKLTLASRLP